MHSGEVFGIPLPRKRFDLSSTPNPNRKGPSRKLGPFAVWGLTFVALPGVAAASSLAATGLYLTSAYNTQLAIPPNTALQNHFSSRAPAVASILAAMQKDRSGHRRSGPQSHGDTSFLNCTA
jgi:hypothetical protein